MSHFLLLPHLKIHNANAMSSPYTIGFPAITAWMGAVHALQRFVNQQGFEEVKFTRLAISCHQFDLQTYRGENDFVSSIIGTANPLDKDGGRPAFVEEARCDLEVSLLIELNGFDMDDEGSLISTINDRLHRMKWASGDLTSVKKASIIWVDEDDPKTIKVALNKLMLGYVLIERRDLMTQAMNDGQDALDALLDHLKLMHRSEVDEQGQVTWTRKRKEEKGWLVPIAVGFQGISPLGKAKHQRDEHTPHRFAESVITLGEFKMPYLFKSLEPLLWQYRADIENNLYLCQTQSQTAH